MLKLFIASLAVLASSSVAYGSSKDTVALVWKGPGSPSLSFTQQFTYGVDNNKVSPSGTSNGLDITVYDNHNNDSTAASLFNSYLYRNDGSQGGAISHLAYQDNVGIQFRPSTLHFMFYGTLTINGYDYSITFGQGHSSLDENNWWVGGPDLTGFANTNSHAGDSSTGAGLPPYTINGILITTDGRFKIEVDDNEASGGNTSASTFSITPMPAASAWMEHLSDSLPISQISMPGTHDSGTYAWGFSDEIYDYQTQDLSILSQLNMGVRALDIRLCMNGSGGVVNICHGDDSIKNMNGMITFSDALEQVSDFLKMNPSEAVTILLKQEYISGGASSADLGREVQAAIVESGISSWQLNYVPTLGDVRGKAVFIVRDYLGATDCNTNSSLGINVDWSDNATFASPSGQCSLSSTNFYIQDQYKDHDSSTKLTDVSKFVTSYQTKFPLSFFGINYLSASNGDSVWFVAQNINNAVFTSFASWQLQGAISSVGATMIDFIGTSNWTTSNLGPFAIIDSVIGKNNFSGVQSTVSLDATHSESMTATSASSSIFSMAESGKSTKDKYKIKVHINLKDAHIDPTEYLSTASRVMLGLKSREFHEVLGNGKSANLRRGKSGRALFMNENEGDLVKVAWAKSYITVTLYTGQARGDGVNLIEVPRQNNRVSGVSEIKAGLGWLTIRPKIKWSGVSQVNGPSADPLALHNWHVRGVTKSNW